MHHHLGCQSRGWGEKGSGRGERRGVTGGQRGSSEGKKEAEAQMEDHQKGCRDQASQGEQFTEWAGQVSGKKQEQQESRGEEKRQINRLKWKHLVEQVGSGNWMQMDGELFVVAKL